MLSTISFSTLNVIKVIAVTASKVKSSSSTINKSANCGDNGALSNNEIAQEEIANKLEDVQDVEW